MPSTPRVLVLSVDEPRFRALHHLLTSAGYSVDRAACSEDASRRVADGEADAALLPDGASVCGDRLPEVSRDGRLARELAMLRARVGDVAQRALVGRSPAIAHVREHVGRAASSRVPVLVTGEPGAGKGVVARLIHDLSERTAGPFVTVPCAGADPDTLERELFGGGEGARAGALDEARGGTVVLQDATALPIALRARLARAAATGALNDAAGSDADPTDARIVLVARTLRSESDAQAMESLIGAFNAAVIDVPPLRERRSDIPQLVQHFRRNLAAASGLELAPLAPEELLPLLGREWPGNVRELEQWVERHALGTTAGPAQAEGDALRGVELGSSQATLEQLERAYIMHVLALESGHQSRTAARLGIDRRTLYRKLKQYRSE